MVPTRAKKCSICGKPVFDNHAKYCPICSKFAFRIMNTRMSPEAIKGIRDYVHRIGYFCYYTAMPLEMTDTHSPWYCVFDHWIPLDPRKIVITSSLINNMKSQLAEEEFWFIIRQLANCKRKHTKIRKIKFLYWNRKYTQDNEEGLGSVVLPTPTTGTCTKKCDVCGKRIDIYNSKYCLLCAKFVARLHSKGLPPETIEATLAYIRKNGFRCYYTGMALELHDASSPWYCVFDHWIPHHPGKIVITSALINQMKSDLSEKEFWYYVFQLADYKEKHKPVRKRKLVYWYRLVPVEDV